MSLPAWWLGFGVFTGADLGVLLGFECEFGRRRSSGRAGLGAFEAGFGGGGGGAGLEKGFLSSYVPNLPLHDMNGTTGRCPCPCGDKRGTHHEGSHFSRPAQTLVRRANDMRSSKGRFLVSALSAGSITE